MMHTNGVYEPSVIEVVSTSPAWREWTREELTGALRQAMIPADAPYAEWRDVVSRAITLLEGPIIEAPAGCVIAHPEHGDHIYPPGVFQVTFQRAYATELRRIAD